VIAKAGKAKNMFKKYINLMLAIFLIIAFTQCKTTYQNQKDISTTNEKALLWRISGQDLQQASYLYGTIHMIPAESFFLPEGTEAAFDTAAVLFLEVDLTELEDPAKQMQMLQQSYMKDDISLSDLVSVEDYEMVKAHFADKGIPLFFLERIKPMFLTVLADNSIQPNSINDGSVKVYEMEFTARAKKENMPIRGLESMEFQMSIMDTIPYEDQAEMLIESIRMAAEGGSQFDSLVNLYITQDIEAMQASIEEDDLSSYDSLLLIQRNHNWIPVMEKNMHEASCFFAVGAAHLGGPDGVIALLRKEGYKLSPVLKGKDQ
jgi:uncharacterized protein YbaP (TraB family)